VLQKEIPPVRIILGFIYIEAVRRLLLPNGELHSGYFIVRDDGGGIKGPGRFDFFTGLLHPYDPSNSLAKLGLADPDRHFAYKIVPPEIAKQVLTIRQYPNLKASVMDEASRLFGF
jgi:hypothetical protein